MLDAPRPEGQRYIVTSKQCTRTPSGKDHYHTTVLDEASGIFYRAGHLTGIMSLLKGVAKRRGPAVLLLRGSERYTGPAAACEA
ncbi:hypothetical protein [Hydrogenophaga intermedia]|nr:hypothetical protein [Hydrogenophaga intermedia]